jgi:hypothetical protein
MDNGQWIMDNGQWLMDNGHGFDEQSMPLFPPTDQAD